MSRSLFETGRVPLGWFYFIVVYPFMKVFDIVVKDRHLIDSGAGVHPRSFFRFFHPHVAS